MLDRIPTLIRPEQPLLIVNPGVVDVTEYIGGNPTRFAQVNFPDGTGQIINQNYKDHPEALQNLLLRWLSAHIDAVRGGAESEDPAG